MSIPSLALGTPSPSVACWEWMNSILSTVSSVQISLKELGVRCWNVWSFAQGLKFKTIFTQKWACRRELLDWTPLPRPFGNFMLCVLCLCCCECLWLTTYVDIVKPSLYTGGMYRVICCSQQWWRLRENCGKNWQILGRLWRTWKITQWYPCLLYTSPSPRD